MLLMSLLGTIFVKNHMYVLLKSFAVLENNVIGMVLRLRSVLERLVLKNYAECTNQRLKPTSGARLMIVFDEPWRTLMNIDEH